jgi:hypothetical protein
MPTWLNLRDRKMATELHKGQVLDDNFREAMGRLQKVVDEFYKLVKDFEKADHVPVESQINQLTQARGSVGEFTQEFWTQRQHSLKKK